MERNNDELRMGHDRERPADILAEQRLRRSEVVDVFAEALWSLLCAGQASSPDPQPGGAESSSAEHQR